ncbi:MAG TPA: hypothetical protein VGC96_05805 [Candidatus Elarobacter sp.]|jgi:hypothetical protein
MKLCWFGFIAVVLACALLTACASAAPVSFPASRIGQPGTPVLTAPQRAAIRAVAAASEPGERERLIVSFPHGLSTKIAGAMVLFYGNPRFPTGVIPPGGDPRISVGGPNGPGSATVAYRVIGGGCNTYYRAADGEQYAVPGDGAGCNTWKESAADRVAKRYGLGAFFR